MSPQLAGLQSPIHQRFCKNRQTFVNKHRETEVTLRHAMYFSLIPSISQSLTAEYRLMTDCLHPPDVADSTWRHLCADEKTHLKQ